MSAAPPEPARRGGRGSREWRKRLDRSAQQVRSMRALGEKLWPHVRPRRGRLALTMVLTLLVMVTRLLEPWPLKLIFDHVLLDRPLPAVLAPVEAWAGGDVIRLLFVFVPAIALIAFASGLFYYHQSILAAKLGQRVVSALRQDLYAHVHRLSFSFHDRRRTGDLLVRLIADIRLLRDAAIKLPLELGQSVFLVVGMAAIMLIMDWRLALISFLALPLLALLVRRYRGPMKRAIRKQRRQEGDLATVAQDSLSAVKVVQGYGLEEREIERFGGANHRSQRQGVKAARLEAKLKWSSDLAVGVVTAVVVGLAVRRILAGALSPGDLVVFVAYLRAFARPLRRASRTLERVTRTSTAGERILEILDTAPDVRDLPGAVPVPRVSGSVRFEGVSFRHGKAPFVLHDVDLDIGAGERVAIVGPTGAGKSTLVSLVPRFYDATSGRVLIDGRDVRDFTLASLRAQVSFVFQEPILFATTIAENIAGGRPGADVGEVVDAARRAGIHHVIAALPDGYDTVLGERGGTLSGGQRQCVSIARAILSDSPIVVLDEPTTGLDARAARLVTDALRRLMHGRTVFMISHDLRRVRDADRVVVMEHGRIAQQGTYDELAARHGPFRDLETADEQP